LSNKKISLLVLFACHNTSELLTQEQLVCINYLTQIPQTKKIIVVSTNEKINLTQSLLEPSDTVEIYGDKNEGLDFGLWWRTIERIKLRESTEFTQLLLINDSCSYISPLNDLFFRMKDHDFWGMTDSLQIAHHIQSYFLAFTSPKSIKNLFGFIDTCLPIKGVDKGKLVELREIALSQHMQKSGHEIKAAFPFHIFTKEITNISFYFHYELKSIGCPSVKNARDRKKRILSATYGANKSTMDVKDLVEKKWINLSTFVVHPHVLRCDPCVFDKKQLSIVWIDEEGEERKCVLNDGEFAPPWSKSVNKS
jgi:hypothetical protein